MNLEKKSLNLFNPIVNYLYLYNSTTCIMHRALYDLSDLPVSYTHLTLPTNREV